MEPGIVDATLQEVRTRLEENDVAGAIALIASLQPADQADVFEELHPEQQEALLPQLEAEDAADILEELEDEDAAELASRLDSTELATIVDEMEPDEAADLLGDLEPALSSATLAQMQEADDVLPLLLHSDQTAGGLMTSEYLAFRQNMRAEQVISTLRTWERNGTESVHLFIVDGENHLVGVANLFHVLRADPKTKLSVLMEPEVFSVRVSDDQETAARLMSRYDLTAVPVVDDDNKLVGAITVDDLIEVLEDEATEDIQRIAGTEPLNRPYMDASVISSAWKRIGWLLLLFVTGTLTGTVMSLFESQIAVVVDLAIFIPLLIGTGGNSGSQTTATIIRALSVGDIGWQDALRVLWRELRTAILLGLLIGVIAYLRAVTWVDSSTLALVVGLSLLAIVIWANTVGAVLPLLAQRLRIDPALVSGPLMSTLVDATGLLIYFTIARVALNV